MKDPRFAKFVVFVNSIIPLAILSWDAYQGQLGTDPDNSLIHTTGMLALIFLLLSLSVTPARLISGWNWLSHFRRMLGLFAFFYGMVHLLIYWGRSKQFSVRLIVEDVARRNFILLGMAALLLMVPLAITSTNAMVKRLGAKRWKLLHRLAYFAAIAGAIHFHMQVKSKNDALLPITFEIILGLLLGYRLLNQWLPFLRRRKTTLVASRE